MIHSVHLEIRPVDTGVELVVDDYELFDYLDDFLVELGLVSVFSGEEDRDGRRWYFMHFNLEVARLTQALSGVSKAEVDRIWALNNSRGEPDDPTPS